VHVARRIEPNLKNVELMNRRYEAYRKLYPALRGIRDSVGMAPEEYVPNP